MTTSPIAFLITNRYQIHHYAPIAAHLGAVTFVIEQRDHDFGVDEALIARHVPGCRTERVDYRDLGLLDGVHDLIVCQTPVLLHRLPRRTHVVAQQYSMAKEAYQYGAWRSLASLNLMYGPYSLRRVEGFAAAVATGNPIFDGRLAAGPPAAPTLPDRLRVLYLPTYGSLSSVDLVLPHLATLDAAVTVKPHHRDRIPEGELPSGWRLVGSDEQPADLITSHDLVISDHSGAAFDAVLARTPLVVVDADRRAFGDDDGLSADERERPLLRRLAASWRPGTDPRAAIERAFELMSDDEAHAAFVERHVSNLGQAGAACAAAIVELLEHGPPAHFGRDRVAERERAYLERQRADAAEIRRLRRSVAKLQRRRDRNVSRVLDPTLAYTRRLVGRSPSLERRLVDLRDRTRRRRTGVERGPGSGSPVATVPPVDDRRGLIDSLTTAGLGLRVAAVRGRLVVGVPEEQLLSLVRTLRSLAREADVSVAFSDGLGDGAAGSIASIEDHLLRGVGSMRVTRDPRSSLVEWLEIDVVTTWPRQTYLAKDLGAARFDWSDDFAELMTPWPPDRGHTAWPEHRVQVVDAVVSWRDRSRPDRHRQPVTGPAVADPDLVRYVLRSIWWHAPFIRRIIILTTGDRPEWLDADHPMITVVRATQNVRSDAEPATSDPHAGGAWLHLVPDLSDHFLYFDGTQVMGREVTVGDLFTEGGLPIVRLSRRHRLPTGSPIVDANAILRDRFGRVFDRRPARAPYAVHRPLLEEVVEVRRRWVTHSTDLSADADVPVLPLLHPLFALAAGQAVEGSPDAIADIDVTGSDGDAEWARCRDDSSRFLAVAAAGGEGVHSGQAARRAARLLEELFPTPSPFER